MKEFNNNLTKYNFNMNEVKVFDVFAGIGALHESLNRLGVPIKITNLSEIDIDAIISYAGIHIDNFINLEFDFPSENEMRDWLMSRNIGYDFEKEKSSIPRLKKDKLYKVYKASVLLNNLGDISQINYNEIEDFDLMNFSFCCQDLSVAGKQRGLKNEDGTPTRSGLVAYGLKAINIKKPKYIMIENVKGLIQKKFIDDFYGIINELEEMGYHCYYPTKEDKKGNKIPTCLNAKDYGIPQNRERIYVICIRKDIDDNTFTFPKGFDSGIRLKDILQDNVDEKYYLSEEIQKRFKFNGGTDINRNELNIVGSSAPDFRTIGQRDITYGINGVMSTLTATDYKQPKQIVDRVGGCFDTDKSTHQAGSVYSKEGISPTLDTMQGGYRQPCIQVIGNLECEGWYDVEKRVHSDKGITPTIETHNRGKYLDENNFKIRKLTPKECWRLMGFKDESFNKVKELGLSDSALYKQAGNSIVVNVLYYIFRSLFNSYMVD